MTDLHLAGGSVYSWGFGAGGPSLIAVKGSVTVDPGTTLDVPYSAQKLSGSNTILTWTTGAAPANVPQVDLEAAPDGATVQWVGGSPATHWDTAANWNLYSYSGGSVSKSGNSLVLSGVSATPHAPLSDSPVVIAPVGVVSVLGPSGPTPIGSLSLGNGTGAISLTVQSGGPLTVAGATTINNATLTANDALTALSVTTSGVSTVNGAGSVGTSANPLSSFTVASGTTNFGGSVTVNSGALNVNGTAVLNAAPPP